MSSISKNLFNTRFCIPIGQFSQVSHAYTLVEVGTPSQQTGPLRENRIIMCDKGGQLRLNQTIRQSEVILDRQIVIHQHSIHSDTDGQIPFFDQLSCTHECANDIRCREHVQFVKVHIMVHVIPHQQVGLNFRNTTSGNRQMAVITDSKRAENSVYIEGSDFGTRVDLITHQIIETVDV